MGFLEISLLSSGFLFFLVLFAVNRNKTFQGLTYVTRCGIPWIFSVVFVLFGLYFLMKSFEREPEKGALLVYLLLANVGMAFTAIYVSLARIYKGTV